MLEKPFAADLVGLRYHFAGCFHVRLSTCVFRSLTNQFFMAGYVSELRAVFAN